MASAGKILPLLISRSMRYHRHLHPRGGPGTCPHQRETQRAFHRPTFALTSSRKFPTKTRP